MNEALVEVEQPSTDEPVESMPDPQPGSLGAPTNISVDEVAAQPGTSGSEVEQMWIPEEERWLFREPEPTSQAGGSDIDRPASSGEQETAPEQLGPLASSPTGAEPADAVAESQSTTSTEMASNPRTASPQAVDKPSAPPSQTVTAVPGSGGLSAAGDGDDESAPRPEPRATPRRPRRRALAIGTAGVLVVVLAAVGAVLYSKRNALPSDAAFRVDGKVVTVDALQRRVEVLGALYGVTAPIDSKRLDAFRRDTAKALVLSIVMTDAAHDKGVAVGAKVVNDALDRIIAQRYPQGGRSDFVRALAVQGIGEQDVRDELRRQLEVRQLYDQVTSGVTVSEDAARKDFLAHPEKYQPPQTRHLRELVVADEASARNILAQLRGGASFAVLARAKSLDASTRKSGGDLGTVTADALDPAFSGPAFAAAKGQAFGPVHTSLGWYVGLVDGIVQPALPTFDSVKDQVRQQLENLAQVKAWRVFLQDRLKKGDAQYASAYKPSNPDALPDSGLTPGPASATTGP